MKVEKMRNIFKYGACLTQRVVKYFAGKNILKIRFSDAKVARTSAQVTELINNTTNRNTKIKTLLAGTAVSCTIETTYTYAHMHINIYECMYVCIHLIKYLHIAQSHL